MKRCLLCGHLGGCRDGLPGMRPADSVGVKRRPRVNRGAEGRLENAQAEAKDKAPAAPPVDQPRKIIYNAQVALVVEEFDKAEEELTRLVKEYKGYVTGSDTHGAPGSPRSGEWTLRIPADQFREFIADLGKLGELRDSKTDSDDVTDRYYDTKAHIQNDQAEEEALRKLMVEKSETGKLEDLLAVRRELRKLRSQIDSQQGQMQRWDKEVAMTTVVVQIQDRKDYVPTTSPSFGTSIGRTFEGSVSALLAFGRGVVLVAVAAAPWLAVLAVPALGAWWLVRNRLKIGRGRAAAAGPRRRRPRHDAVTGHS